MPTTIRIEEGNITRYAADVLVLKYATRFFGVDLKVAGLLGRAGVHREEMTPEKDGFKLLATRNAVETPRVLLVSVPPPGEFDAANLSKFMLQALHILASDGEAVGHVITTLHGPGLGLDEGPAIRAQLDGILSAIAGGHVPATLERFTIVESNPSRVHSMRERMVERLEGHAMATALHDGGFRITV